MGGMWPAPKHGLNYGAAGAAWRAWRIAQRRLCEDSQTASESAIATATHGSLLSLFCFPFICSPRPTWAEAPPPLSPELSLSSSSPSLLTPPSLFADPLHHRSFLRLRLSFPSSPPCSSPIIPPPLSPSFVQRRPVLASPLEAEEAALA